MATLNERKLPSQFHRKTHWAMELWPNMVQSQPVSTIRIGIYGHGLSKNELLCILTAEKKRKSFIKKVCKESGLLTTLFCFVPFITEKRGGRRCSIVISIHFCWLINFICNLCIFGNYKNWNVYYRPGGENSGAKKNNDSNNNNNTAKVLVVIFHRSTFCLFRIGKTNEFMELSKMAVADTRDASDNAIEHVLSFCHSKLYVTYSNVCGQLIRLRLINLKACATAIRIHSSGSRADYRNNCLIHIAFRADWGASNVKRFDGSSLLNRYYHFFSFQLGRTDGRMSSFQIN